MHIHLPPAGLGQVRASELPLLTPALDACLSLPLCGGDFSPNPWAEHHWGDNSCKWKYQIEYSNFISSHYWTIWGWWATVLDYDFQLFLLIMWIIESLNPLMVHFNSRSKEHHVRWETRIWKFGGGWTTTLPSPFPSRCTMVPSQSHVLTWATAAMPRGSESKKTQDLTMLENLWCAQQCGRSFADTRHHYLKSKVFLRIPISRRRMSRPREVRWLVWGYTAPQGPAPFSTLCCLPK